jgi:hypothetical protein
MLLKISSHDETIKDVADAYKLLPIVDTKKQTAVITEQTFK